MTEFDSAENMALQFMRRTRRNQEVIEGWRKQSTEEFFDVTQRLNSLLGLLVVPKEGMIEAIPMLEQAIPPLTMQVNCVPEWGDVKFTFEIQPMHLRRLVKHLRNAIAHGQFEFDSDGDDITSVTFGFSMGERDNKPVWKVRFSVEELDGFVGRLYSAIAPDTK